MHVDDFEKNNKSGRNPGAGIRSVGRMNTVNEFFQERGVSGGGGAGAGGVSRNRYSCNSYDFQFRPKKYTV